MSVWGKIKGVAKGVGGLAQKAAPFVGLIPGVGTLAAAGIGAAGGLLHGDGLKGALKSGALGAAGALGGNLLGKIPGVGGLMSKVGLDAKTFGGGVNALKNTLHLGGGGAPDAPVGAQQMVNADGIMRQDPSTLAHISGGTDGDGGGVMDWLKSSGGMGGGGADGQGGVPNWMKLIGLAGGVAGTVQNAQANTQNRQLTEEQIAQARAAIIRQKELQDRALQPINVQAPDYTSIFAQTQNPFYQRGA